MMIDKKEIYVLVAENDTIKRVLKVLSIDKSLMNCVQSTTQNYSVLTERERDVLRLITEGKSNMEIASELIMSIHTTKADICSILQKLKVRDRVQAAIKAVKENLV